MAVSVVKTKVENTTVEMGVDDFVIYALAKLTEVAKAEDKEAAKQEIAAIQKASALARAKTREMQAALNQGDGKPLGMPVEAVVIQSDREQSYSEPTPVAQPAGSAAVQNPEALNSVGAAPSLNSPTTVPDMSPSASSVVMNPEALAASTGFTTDASVSAGGDSKPASAVVMNPDALNSVAKENETSTETSPTNTNALDPASWQGQTFASKVNE